MQNILKRQETRSVMLAVMIIGFLALIFGLYRFINSSQQLEGNLAYKIQSSGQSIDPQSTEEAQMYMGAEIEHLQLLRQRSESVIFIGTGIVLIAFSWLANDFVRARLKT